MAEETVQAIVQESSTRKQDRKPFFFKIAAGIVVIAFLFLLYLGFTTPQGLFVFGNKQSQVSQPLQNGSSLPAITSSETSSINTVAVGSDIIKPEDFPIREEYFREVYRPRRETYKLFERAAKYFGKDIEYVKKYFGLNSEEEIFAELPKPAEDFSEIAYLFASGKFFAIGLLKPEYYLQPELYPNFKINGLNYWTKPDPRYWTPHGYGSYPSEQWDTLSLSERKEFTGVVFVQTGWGVQTYQGVSLLPDSEFVKHFDVEITPQNFLLEPAWPKFHKNWAQRVLITGKAKPGTPPGNYNLTMNVYPVPKELREKWEFEHKNLYFDAAVSSVKPAGNFIDFHITVTE